MNVTLPDGSTITDIPEGTTQTQIAEKLKRNGKPVPDSWLAGGKKNEIPDSTPQPKAPDEGGVMDTLKGVPGAVATMGTGAVGSGVGSIVAAIREMAARSMGADQGQGRLEGQEAGGKVADALTHQPSEPAKRVLGKVGDAMDATGASKLAGLNPATPMGMVGAPANRTIRQIMREESGLAKDAGSAAVSKVKDALPAVEGEKAALARKAEEFGIQIPPHKLSDNRFVRLIGEALDNVPASGSVGDKNQVAFNSAIGKMIGAREGTKRITRGAFNEAMENSGSFIGEVAERTPVPISAGSKFEAALAAQGEAAAASGLADVEKMIGGYVKDIHAAAKDGVIDGKAFRRLNTKVGNAVREMAPGDRKMALNALHEDMMEALLENVSPADRDPLQAARKQYAIGKTIEPLVSKAPSGDIPPSQLMGVLTRDKAGKSRMARGKGGDLGDLADVAQMFLKDQPSSMTTERGLAYGAIGGGLLAEPITAASIYGAANLYNRVGPKVSKSMTRIKDLDADARNTPIRQLETE